MHGGTLSPDVASCDALFAIAEDVALQERLAGGCCGKVTSTYSDKIDPSQDEDDNTGANNDAPERQSKLLLSARRLVEVAHHIDT